MQRYLSRFLAFVLVAVIGLTGCSANTPSGLVGNYRQDATVLLQTLRTAVELPDNSPEKSSAQAQARQAINDFASLYRRESALTKSASYTTIRTILNSMAGHYSSYPNRPIPQKLKDRLELEFKQAEMALQRGA